jgi:uncharacterized protein (TIGR02466 family)
MSIQIKKLFPTLIASGSVSNASEVNRKLLRDIETFAAEDKMGQKWSRDNYREGYTSYASLSDLHLRSPVFSRFAEILQPHAEAFAKAQDWELRGLNLEMTACWMNIMRKHTYHTLHLHPHSVISGVYYVSTPRGSVSLRLEDPRMTCYMSSPIRRGRNKEHSLYYEITPTPGTFVLFESWLRHEVPPNQSTHRRVSLSFNYSLEVKEDP